MDLAFAAEQYAQAQSVAAAVAQYYANAANAAAMNAAAMNAAAEQGHQGLQGFGIMQQMPQLTGTSMLGPQFLIQTSAHPFQHLEQQMQQQHQQQQQQQQQQQLQSQKPRSPPRYIDRDDSDPDERRERSRRERNRSPPRRSRSRDRDRRDDRRPRDRDRNRGRSRSRSNSSERRSRRRDRSPKRDRDRARDKTPDSGDDDVPPNNTIMVRGLAQHISENDIRQDINALGLAAKDIRLIRKKETGASRGFAFVEFATVDEARVWMESKQGVLMFKDQYRAVMQYSLPRDARSGEAPKALHDWICLKCGVQNFRRRDQCFKCGGPKTENEPEGSEEVSSNPTSTVLLRGLDVLSTEDSVLTYLMRVTNLPIKGIRIGRDPLTNTSRGICYVEMNTLVDAMFLHNQLLGEPPTIDDKLISVSYHRMAGAPGQPGSAAPAPAAANALAAAQWNSNQQSFNDEVERLAEYSANLYAKTAEEKTYYLDYYRNYYRNGGTKDNATNPKQAGSEAMVKVNGVEYKRYPTPDVSSYTYDESSGYYYDAQTGLYYDANSTYYYNSKTSSYCYWSQEHHTYLPANSDDTGKGGDDGDKKKEDKKDKVKTAKKIAKDMERWAKTQNQRKEAAKASQPASAPATSTAAVPVPAAVRGGGLEDLAFSMLQKQTGSSAAKPISTSFPPKPEVGQTSGLARLANYGSDSDNEDQGLSASKDNSQMASSSSVTDESKLIDWVKLACLLCMRQFPNKEKLTKHTQISDLHKQNLESWRNDQEPGSSSAASRLNSQQYRDRAKERREKYGEGIEARPNMLKEKYLRAIEEADSGPLPERTIGSENLGNKMLQKMGWKEGLGLGKANQGRTNIVEVDHRGSQAGLGNRAPVKMNPNEHYRDAAKRSLFLRYQDQEKY